jgi:very-short-patch-repair endonuclease
MQGAPVQIRGAALERHRARRAQRVPTVTVLLGEPDVAEWYWARWQRSQQTTTVRVAGAQSKDVLGTWLASKPVCQALREALLEQASRAYEVSRAELWTRIDAHADGQREALHEQLSARLADWPPALIAAALGSSDEALPGLVRRGFPAALGALDARLPRGLPALLWRSSSDLMAKSLDGPFSTLVAIAEAAPRVELALAVTVEQLALWQQGARPRSAALIREGIVRLEPRARAPECGGAAAASLIYEEEEYARSRAEALLYRRLQSRARTRGLFELNQELPERFGGKRLEIDLLCASSRLAVEVDGYHHFQDAAAYRRDRDKDLVLQQLGYTVVRVLASDVEQELAYVVERIDRALEHRQREGAR